VVRIFDERQVIAEIIPEGWLLSENSFKISGPRKELQIADLRIVSVKQRPKRHV
jgi:hypothetical protein